IPELFLISVENRNLVFDHRLVFSCGGIAHSMNLRGIVYLGDLHFVSRFISAAGVVWYHDGIETGRRCVREGLMRDMPSMD
ncbi:hypothetical protein B0H16DRAFT_1254680, partial [Mycena metata]